MGVNDAPPETPDDLYDDWYDEEYMKILPYANAVGSLKYYMICTRPDLAYHVGIVCRLMGNPIKDHWLGVVLGLRINPS